MLPARSIAPGAAEFAVTNITSPPDGVMDGGLTRRRMYSGYLALHFAASGAYLAWLPDEAACSTALETFWRQSAISGEPAVVNVTAGDSAVFINPATNNTQGPVVLTVELPWDLTLDLEN